MTDLREQLQRTLTGAFTLERELGGGGMSRVFVADETRLGRKVVVKVLSPELAAGISAERFEREIRTAASLQQANIVPVLATGDTNGLPYYTMPFVEGESLRRRIGEQPPLSVSDTIRILGDVSRALQYAHDHGIVHRDIKPDNVLLSGGTAVVTDFGIAKALSDSRVAGEGETLTQLGTSIGTPAYMAPEQAAGDPNIDRRADIYALGCMAFELLTGKPPFHGRTPSRTLGAHMGEAPPSLRDLRPDISPALADLVMQCLAKDADARPQTAAEVISALNGVTSGGGMPTLPAALLQGPPLGRALAAYIAAVIAVAAIAKAATIVIGLPEWVFPGALIVMAIGLPIILFTAYVQSVTRRALLSTPAVTPGGGTASHGTMANLALKASPHMSWRRTTRGGVIALGAFASLILAVMLMRAFGIGPVGSLFAAGRLNQRDMILVSDFAVSHADSSVGSVVAEGVRANLATSQSIVVFNASRVAEALKRMELPTTSKLDLALARQLALREGVKAVVSGNVTGLGNGFVIALQLVAVDSGTVLASYQTTVDGPSGLVGGVDELTRKLRAKIGESLKSVQASPPLAQVTTSSYDALKAYTEGARAFDYEHDFTKAIPLLRRAVAIDTGFATAWRRLGTAMANAFYPQSSVDSAVTTAFRMRSRLSENERYMTEAYYYLVGQGHDRQKAIVAYQALVASGDSVKAANNLAVAYTSMREYAKADSMYRISLRSNPDNLIPLPNVVNSSLDLGNRAAADSFLAMEAKKLPFGATRVFHLIILALADGKYDRAQAIGDSIVGDATAKPPAKLTALKMGARLLLIRGRITQSDQRARDALAAAKQVGNDGPPIGDSLALAFNDVWFRNQAARAIGRLDVALKAHPIAVLAEQDRPYTDLARVYALAGQPAKAKTMLAQFASIRDTAFYRSELPRVHRAQGEIALAEKRYADAISEFRKGDLNADGRPDTEDPVDVLANLGRAFDLASMRDSAIVTLEAYLSSTYTDRIFTDSYMLAGAHKRLGELYEAKGERDKAISHFTTFIELWKNADPELQPAVAEVRRRLARLQANSKS